MIRIALSNIALAVCTTGFVLSANAQTLIERNSTWRYEDSGTDLGTDWYAPTYNDSAWSSGPGLLGFGESEIQTTVSYGPDPLNKHPTTYFRISFDLASDPLEGLRLLLSANFDDGYVAYLNGQEVMRQSMPAGTITFTTLATSHESGFYETVNLTDFIGLLMAGSNVLAVEVHQRGMTSSDLAWDCDLVYSTLPAIVTRGPYLQIGSPDGVTVRWRTDVPTNSRLVYSSSATVASFVYDAAMTTEHELRAEGLTPATTYFYSVGTFWTILAGDDPDHFFRTSPVPGSAVGTRIWVIGDSGEANQNARDVRDAYLAYTDSTSTDVWLMLGDNAYSSGTDLEYQHAVFDMYPQLLVNTLLWPTRGNHDQIHTGPDNDYYEIFTLPDAAEAGGLVSGTEAYYSFDYANVHFVCLDSEGSDRSPTGAMLTWLELDLALTTQDWIVAYWHHPPYTKGSHDSDNPGDSGGRMRDMRENALPILEQGGVDLVLSGHSHSYERSMLIDGHYGLSSTFDWSMAVNIGDGNPSGDGDYRKPIGGPTPHAGSVYAVPGSSSKTSGGSLDHPVMLTSLNELGSMVLDVSDNRLDAIFLDDSGFELDRFAIFKDEMTDVEDDFTTRTRLALGPPAPNPSNRGATLRFATPAEGHVRLRMFDVAGRLVASVLDGVHPAGAHVVVWHGGAEVAGGVYFAVLEFARERRVRKLIVTR